VVDPVTGHDLPPGQRGEIWMRGRGLMPGYFRDPQATAAVMREGGWYASGDLGVFAEDGALSVVGRLKEMIIRSGFNVYPGEVEAVLNAFPAVQRSAVVGQREADGNEAVIAFVELRAGAPRRRRSCGVRRAPRAYKVPRDRRNAGAAGASATGKVLKATLANGRGSLDREVGARRFALVLDALGVELRRDDEDALGRHLAFGHDPFLRDCARALASTRRSRR
jgi:acyl-CoA synthetase (AMP-forming)/AMP-acid ligase II